MKQVTIGYPWDAYHKWQKEVFTDPHRFKVLVWHRRARKTSTGLTYMIDRAFKEDGTYWYISPSYALAKDTIWKDPNMLENILPDEIEIRKNEVELTRYIRTQNGKVSVFSLKGSDRPDLLRGPNPRGVILDEFDDMKEEVWTDVIYPVLRANKGWAMFLGTPKGKRGLFRVYQRGLVPNDEWKTWYLKADESGILSKEDLARAREDMPEHAFQQEFMAAFLEGSGTIFRNVRELMTSEREEPQKGANYVIGYDPAKHQDYSVIVVYNRSTLKQVYQDRTQKVSWGLQKKKVKEISRFYNNALVIMDATGVGDPIYDDLSADGVPIMPYKFTNESKKALIDKLSIYLEQKRIRLLPIEDTAVEFESYSYDITAMGRITYSAPPGGHDDIVTAHALAVHDLFPQGGKKPEEPKLTLLQEWFQRKMKERHREEVIIDDEWYV